MDGPAKMEVLVPRGPMRLKDLVPIAQQVARENVDRAFAHEKNKGNEVSCKSGCAACCRQIVPISAPEAFRQAEHVLGLDPPRRDRNLARIDAVDGELQATGLLDELAALAGGTHPSREDLGNRYFDRRIACPFLHEESCSVYAERPLVCRHYAVTTPAS